MLRVGDPEKADKRVALGLSPTDDFTFNKGRAAPSKNMLFILKKVV